YLHLNLEVGEEEKEDTGPPVKFIGKSLNEASEDPTRVARARGSKGYKAALQMVYDAIQQRATDIHLEPERNQTAVRFRIDGILQRSEPFSRAMGDAVINIFKVLSDMDIVEKRKPQDGSFSARVEDRVVDFRVASAGSVAGEKLTMRVFDRGQQILDLGRVGMRDSILDQVKNLIAQPHGMIIVCGPTGSGKSTTLYSGLNQIDRFQKNVMTIENPVECQVHNVTQIEVNLKAGKTFASELRSMLRQDPDVIMIGEIRDPHTPHIPCHTPPTPHATPPSPAPVASPSHTPTTPRPLRSVRSTSACTRPLRLAPAARPWASAWSACSAPSARCATSPILTCFARQTCRRTKSSIS